MILKWTIPGACLLAFGTAAALSHNQTNGASVWGTLQAPQFPEFITSNPLPDEYP